VLVKTRGEKRMDLERSRTSTIGAGGALLEQPADAAGDGVGSVRRSGHSRGFAICDLRFAIGKIGEDLRSEI